MCGIVGVYNKNGVTEEDLRKFTKMLDRARSRGIHATGVISDDIRALKAPIASNKFIETDRYKNFLQKVIGQKFVIGHCRQATRGSPSDNQNNHPITTVIVLNDKEGNWIGDERIGIVHNGTVECKKWDEDQNANDKEKAKTDTYIFLNALKSFYNREVDGNERFPAAVKKSFEDVDYNATTNSSVVVAFDSKHIVFCKSQGKPMVFQFLENNERIYFASETSIMRPESIDVDGSKYRNWSEMENDAFLMIDVEAGILREGFLSTFVPPSPIRQKSERVRDGLSTELKRKIKTWNAEKYASGKTQTFVEDPDPLELTADDFEDATEYVPSCFDCFDARFELFEISTNHLYCSLLAIDVDPNVALTCNYFQRLVRFQHRKI